MRGSLLISLCLIIIITGVKTVKVKVGKCCDVDSLLVETSLGYRECRKRLEIDELNALGGKRWRPKFYDFETGKEIERPEVYVLESGFPDCSSASDEVLFSVFHHRDSVDEFQLLLNGSLAHRLNVDDDKLSAKRIYSPGKYCIDDLMIAHNFTSAVSQEGEILEFAYICVRRSDEYGVQRVVDEFVYPIGLSVSMLCLILTFLLYSFLPQLRDLTGKFILGICTCLSVTFSLFIVDIFGWRDPNVEKLVTELLLHVSIVGVWFCLNSMGHHVWKIIRSKSVFTRVTDGQRLFYYSIYVITGTSVVSAMAICIHFLIEEGKGRGGHYKIGWSCLATFYTPVIAILFVNVYFYWTSQRRISRQLIYNRSMQHFQVNFDLYIKFLIVIGVWWLFQMLKLLDIPLLRYVSMIFNILQGPLVFCVSMCRTRVAYLFKKYFCEDSCCFGCCKSQEFIEEECEELATIDGMKLRDEKSDSALPTTSLLSPTPTATTTNCFFNSTSTASKELSRSLYNFRHRDWGVEPPPDPDKPVGRIARLLKSNSMTAIANINFGWRKETSV